MKPDIHTDYHPVVFQDANTGATFLTRSTLTSARTVEWQTPQGVSTYPLVVVEVTSDSHPFWTGNRRIVDTAGQVEKFRRRYGSRQSGRGQTRQGVSAQADAMHQKFVATLRSGTSSFGASQAVNTAVAR